MDVELKAIGGKRDPLVRRLPKLYSLGKTRAEKEAEDFVQALR